MAKSITYNDTPDGYAQKQSFVIQYDQIEMLADSPEDIALIVCFIKDIDDFLANDTGFDFAAKYGDSPAIKYCLAGALSAEKSNVRKWAESQKKALKASYSSKYRDFKGLDSRARVSDEDFYQFIDGTPVGARYRAILERISLLSEHRLDANLIKHVKPTSTLRMLVAPSSISKKPLETETVTVTETSAGIVKW